MFWDIFKQDQYSNQPNEGIAAKRLFGDGSMVTPQGGTMVDPHPVSQNADFMQRFQAAQEISQDLMQKVDSGELSAEDFVTEFRARLKAMQDAAIKAQMEPPQPGQVMPAMGVMGP